MAAECNSYVCVCGGGAKIRNQGLESKQGWETERGGKRREGQRVKKKKGCWKV